MPPVSVDSSFIKQIQFDESANTVTVTFGNGSSVTKGCSREMYDQFLKAESKGKFFNQHLKNT